MDAPPHPRPLSRKGPAGGERGLISCCFTLAAWTRAPALSHKPTRPQGEKGAISCDFALAASTTVGGPGAAKGEERSARKDARQSQGGRDSFVCFAHLGGSAPLREIVVP